MMKTFKVWEILKEFKDSCKCSGWKTSENEDWIKTNNEYHNFLWARNIHPSSFKKIVASRRCVICEGPSYHVVEASYTAWLFSEKPSEDLIKTILQNPNTSSRVAVYDMSPMMAGRNICARLNQTESTVFREFENFLKSDMKIKLRSFSSLSDTEVNTNDCSIAELA